MYALPLSPTALPTCASLRTIIASIAVSIAVHSVAVPNTMVGVGTRGGGGTATVYGQHHARSAGDSRGVGAGDAGAIMA